MVSGEPRPVGGRDFGMEFLAVSRAEADGRASFPVDSTRDLS